MKQYGFDIVQLGFLWSPGDSTLFGKTSIMKSLLTLSKICFHFFCSPGLSNFIWNNKTTKIKGSPMIGNIKDGGLNMPDFDIIQL